MCELEILTRSLCFVYHHSWGGLSQFDLGAHLLNLRGLVFYCCRETRNRGLFAAGWDLHQMCVYASQGPKRVSALRCQRLLNVDIRH